jgi:hypothetical protein
VGAELRGDAKSSLGEIWVGAQGVFGAGAFFTPWSAADLATFHSHGRPSSVSSEDSTHSYNTVMREDLVRAHDDANNSEASSAKDPL